MLEKRPATQIGKQKFVWYKDEIYYVRQTSHDTQGRRQGSVLVTLDNLATGSTKEVRFGQKDRIECCITRSRGLVLSYYDEEHGWYHFMDPDNDYEAVEISADLVNAKEAPFLAPDNTYNVLFVEDRKTRAQSAIKIEIPPIVKLLVTEAIDSIRGDTATHAQKSVRTETGLHLQVPLFIRKDSQILVSTKDGSYQGQHVAASSDMPSLA